MFNTITIFITLRNYSHKILGHYHGTCITQPLNCKRKLLFSVHESGFVFYFFEIMAGWSWIYMQIKTVLHIKFRHQFNSLPYSRHYSTYVLVALKKNLSKHKYCTVYILRWSIVFIHEFNCLLKAIRCVISSFGVHSIFSFHYVMFPWTQNKSTVTCIWIFVIFYNRHIL